MFGRVQKTEAKGIKDLRSLAYMPGGVLDLVLASVFTNVLSLGMPLMLLQVYDRIIPNSGTETLVLLVIGVGTALILESLLKLGRSYVSGWMGARFEHLAGCAAIERLLGASIIDFERDGAGTHLERYNALSSLKEFYAGQAILVVCDLPFALLFLGAMAYLAGWLVVVPVVLIVIFASVAYYIGTHLKNALNNRMQADDRRFSFIIEVLSGIHTVKGLAMEEQMLRRYERLQETSASAEYNVALHSASAQSSGAIFSQLVLFLVVGFGSILVIDGVLTVGGLAACTMLSGRAMGPLQKAVGIWTRFQSIQIARDRMAKLFAMDLEKPAGLPHLPPIVGDFELDNVTFTYGINKDGEEIPPLFEHISIKVNAGQVIGVSGENASGKTSLLYIIMGLFKPQTGRMLTDGYDLQEFDASSIRTQIAYLPQEGHLFNGSILENVTMFRDDLVDTAMDMSRLLGLDAVVTHMPRGYDTIVGDSAGDKLPRGIKQRIAIARALVDRPRILLFDEANSAMDTSGDDMLREMLEKLKGRVTIVLVTPRPSLLRISDRIFDIQDKRLVERIQDSAGLNPPTGREVQPA